MDPDQDLYPRGSRRILVFITVISTLGVTITWLSGGWRGAAGFLAGAAASYLNFRWLKQLVEALGEAATRRRLRKRVAVFMGLRYLLLGLGAYVILNYSALSLNAALLGLFVPVAAVIVEILFELTHGT